MMSRARGKVVGVAVATLCIACSSESAPPGGGAEQAARSQARAYDAAPPPQLRRSPRPNHKVFANASEALAEILASKPRVIGFGEYHELKSSVAVNSTLHRFTNDMLEALAVATSDLIVETWVEAGKCGKEEKRVGTNVRKVTERPKHTQSEIVVMIKRAQKLGISAHMLEFHCEDYKAVLVGGNQVDYEKMLVLIASKLRDKALEGLAHRKPEQLITLYGGSLHNDLYPAVGVEDFSYAAAVAAKSDDSYVEVDLYVPEYIDGDSDLAAEPWFPIYRELVASDKVVLIERAPRSYVLILRKQQMRAVEPG